MKYFFRGAFSLAVFSAVLFTPGKAAALAILPKPAIILSHHGDLTQLTTITRPDGQVVSLGYDTGGRLATMRMPNGATTYAYSPTTGHLTSVAAPSAEILSYTYDGFLPLSETWSGAVTGSVARTYNTDFRVTSLNVNGVNSIPLAYDADGLLTTAGMLAITRSAQNGFVTGATLGGIATAYTYNTFGELASERHTGAGTTLYDVAYTRDKLGRITSKLETIGGIATTYGYIYDAAGRLVQVTKNGAVTAAYAYDQNGNRIGKTDAMGGIIGYTYDGAGRVISKTLKDGRVIAFTYDASGLLVFVTDVYGNATTVEHDAQGNPRPSPRPTALGFSARYVLPRPSAFVIVTLCPSAFSRAGFSNAATALR